MKKSTKPKICLLSALNGFVLNLPASAKFMYENGVMAGYVPEEGIRSAKARNNRYWSTWSWRDPSNSNWLRPQSAEWNWQSALNNCLKTAAPSSRKNIAKLWCILHSRRKSATPAMKKFRAKYGVIPNVSENDYPLPTPPCSRMERKCLL